MRTEEKRPLADQVADKITEYILENNLKPNQRVPNEYKLAELLKVGRSTVREAVKILESRNILEIRHGAGTFVSKKRGISDDPLGLMFMKDKKKLAMDMLSVRLMLEPEIAALAAKNATREQIRRLLQQCDVVEETIRQNEDHTREDIRLHKMIARCSGNIVVENLIPVIHSSITVFISVTSGELRNETVETHREIVEAISKRDCEGAKCAMNMHLIYNRRRINQLIGKDNAKNIPAWSGETQTEDSIFKYI